MLIIPEILFTITVLVTAAYLFWAVPKKITAAFFLPLMLVSYLASLDLLGWPAPIWAEWRIQEDGIYVYHVLNEPEAIYVWIIVEDTPRAYAFPWSEELAEQLEQAKGNEEETGTQLRLKFPIPFDRSIEDRNKPMFYDYPQPSDPPKYKGGP